MSAVEVDPLAAELALRAPAALRQFNAVGLLTAADVHVAVQLGTLSSVGDPGVLLALAFAVRAPRTGHVFVDLATVSETAAVESEEAVDLSALPWPEVDGWVAAVRACGGLVGSSDEDSAEVRPLRLIGTRLYLVRYWREEQQLAAGLVGFAGGGMKHVDVELLTGSLARLFPSELDALQRAAAACAVLRGLAVIAGGPGTGKTTTVARVAALLFEQAEAAGAPAPLIALCAPTGKAAARLEEAVREEAVKLPVSEEIRAGLLALKASTIHRLLGWRPGSHSRFRHDAANRLPHDVVIVDETSMVGLTLMGRLLEAVRADARVVLVGDPDQLTAIEAGAVLRDIVGPASGGLQIGDGMRALLDRVTGVPLPVSSSGATGAAGSSGATRSTGAAGTGFGDGIVALQRGHRFGAAIEAVAGAIRRGDGDAVLEAMGGSREEVSWLPVDIGVAADAVALEPLRQQAVASGAAVLDAARAGDGERALAALGAFRLLCAHRRGPYGVSTWTAQIERWLTDSVDGFLPTERDYAGRPLLITENDYELRLFNGDTGVVVRSGPGRISAAFERDGEVVQFSPSRLGAVQTLHAMTIHKSQGSQFDVAAVLLPDPASRILTRELLYTAVTRARRRLVLIGSEEAIRAAVERPVARATGLRERLWTKT